MRYKVPQNIDMPDRIIGPLTMIQFVEAVLGGGLAYICFNAFPSPINVGLALIAGMFTVAVVFVKINERPFLFYFMALMKFIGTPKRRVWHQTDGADDMAVEIYHPPKNEGPQIQHKQLDRNKIAELAKEIDSQNIDRLKIQ